MKTQAVFVYVDEPDEPDETTRTVHTWADDGTFFYEEVGLDATEDEIKAATDRVTKMCSDYHQEIEKRNQ